LPSVQAQLRESGRTRREQDHGAFESLKAPRDPLTAAIQPVHWVILTPPNFLSIELVSQLLNTALSCFLHTSGDIASLVFPRGFGFVPMVAHAGSSLCLTAANMSFVPQHPVRQTHRYSSGRRCCRIFLSYFLQIFALLKARLPIPFPHCCYIRDNAYLDLVWYSEGRC
jgi:hypothetical protein